MHYMIAFVEPLSEFTKRADPAQSGPYWGAWSAYIGAVSEAGVMVSGNGLQGPETATIVQIRDSHRQIHDGPFADSKEVLGGYLIIDVPDLDAAIEWAARSPASAVGHTDVRPVLPPMPA